MTAREKKGATIVLRRDDFEKVTASVEGECIEITDWYRNVRFRDGQFVPAPGYQESCDGGASLSFDEARAFAEWVFDQLRV